MNPRTAHSLLDFPAHAPGENHLRFERLLSDVAAAFLNLGSRDMDGPISTSLGDLLVLVGGDRGGIAQFSEDGHSLFYAHPFPRPEARLLASDLAAARPWCAGELRAGRRVVLPRLPESLPEEARAEWAGVARDGLKSHLSLPLKVGDEVLGALCVDHLEEHHSWSPELLSRLELLASLYAHTFYRRRAEDRLQGIHDLNRSVLASVPSEIVVLDHAGRVVTVNEAWTRSARRKAVPTGRLPPGSDYLAAAEEALARGQVAGRQGLAGLRAVLSGERPSFRATYRYESAAPDEPARHYLLTVSPRTVGEGVVLVHTEVTELEETKAALERSLGEVEALKERLEAENVVLQQQVRHAHGFLEDRAAGAVLQADRKIVVVGSAAFNNPDFDFAVMRLNGGAPIFLDGFESENTSAWSVSVP